MPYVSLDNLARFHGRMRGRASSEFASLGMANWQKTAAAGAVSFSPVPEMPLDPVVNFQFTETGPASGTKAPDNPSTITGVSSIDVTRTNTNLLLRRQSQSETVAGITFTCDGNGSYIATGAATRSFDTGDTQNFKWDLRKLPNGRYILKFKEGLPQVAIGATIIRGGVTSYHGYSQAQNLIVLYEDTIQCVLYFYGGAGTTAYDNAKTSPYLVLEGSDAVFEIPQDSTYTINLGGTYYGGSVDLSTGVMTVTHYFNNVTFNNVAAVNTNTITLYVPTTYNFTGWAVTGCCSNRFVFSVNTNDEEHFRGVGPNLGSNQFNFYLNKSRLDLSGAVDPSNPTDAEWLAAAKFWLAENPTFVVYPMLSPITVQLTPQQIYSLSQPDPYNPRINTVYSDQVSVQAGYPKSPQASQNELTSAIVSLGGNV